MKKSTPPSSLRNIPPDALKLAHALGAQMGLSLSDVFRLALVSGLLVEATKVAPGPDGTLAGWRGPVLAKALRRHLGSAIDLLIEYGEHPYNAMFNSENSVSRQDSLTDRSNLPFAKEEERPQKNAIKDDLEDLGIGLGLSAGQDDDR